MLLHFGQHLSKNLVSLCAAAPTAAAITAVPSAVVIAPEESASEARFLALAQKFLPVKFPKVLEFQDEEELVKWFKGPWPQGELQGPLNKFKDSARGSSGAISTKLVSNVAPLAAWEHST
jgi:hypothetical protein